MNEIYDECHNLFNRLNIFTNKCIEIVFDQIVDVFDNKEQKWNNEPMLSKQEKDELIERNLKYSSMSVIHYFDNKDAEETKEMKMTMNKNIKREQKKFLWINIKIQEL